MVKEYERLVNKGRYLVPESRQNSKGGYRPNRSTYGVNNANAHNVVLKPLRVEKYVDLSLFVIKNPSPDKHGGYKYLITRGATSSDAFYTENGLKRFLQRTGLKRKLVRKSSNGTLYQLIGSYERISMAGDYKQLNEFGRSRGLTRTKILSNGDYTTAYYGNGKIYYLNPNYRRTIYNYFRE